MNPISQVRFTLGQRLFFDYNDILFLDHCIQENREKKVTFWIWAREKDAIVEMAFV